MGSSRCALQSPIFQSHFPFPASSSSSTSSRPSRAGGYSPKRAGRWKVSAMKAEDARDIGGSRRRALVLVGLSAIRFLQLPAMAIVDDLEKGSDSGEIAETNPKAPDGGFSPISVLSPFGIVGSGVLGALYAISQKEKAEMELSIASMNTTLSEKEARNVSLEVNFRRRLEKQQEEHRNQVGKLKEEEELLNRELTSAKATVSAIGLELKSEKKLAEDLKSQIEKLQSSLNRSLGERRALEATLKEREDSIIGLDNKVNSLVLEIENKEAALLTLRSNLSDRESEIGELTSAAEKTRSELEETVSALTHLRIDHLAVNGELELKKSEIDDLKKRIESVIGERDEAIEKNRTLQAELAQLKTSFEEKSASDFELLTKKEEEVRRLEENLATALSQSTSSWELIAEMTLERENLKVKLEEESKNLNAMKEEFLLAQQNLEDQKQAVSDLSEQLQKNEKVNAELNFEISMVKKESLETETLLKISLEEERATVGSLADELDSIKGALTKAQEELAATTEELKAALKTRDELKDELAVSEEKTTFITQELERERNTVATLNSQLEESTRKRDELYREKVETEKNLDEAMTSLVQVNERVLALTVLNSKLEESAQKTYELSKEKVEIEKSLEEALASLAEVNERVLALTNELEEGKSVNGALQAEKDMIFQSLAEHRETAREAQENIEDAQKVITYLGEERERLEKKVKKFEEELAASKGEILRLRRQANLHRETATQQTAKSPENEPVGEASVSKRSVASRRKKASARVSRPES